MHKIHNLENLKKEILNQNKKIAFKALVLKLSDYFGNVKKVAEFTGLPATTIYNWVKKWNKYGISGLKDKQGKGGGRISYISDNEWKIIKEYLHKNDHISIKVLGEFISKHFSVRYSNQHLQRIKKKYKK